MPDELSPIGKDGLYTMVQTVLQQAQTQAITIAIIQRDLSDVKSESVKLASLIREGQAGQPSLLVRSALIEKTLAETGSSMQELRKMLEARAAEDQKGRWQIVATVISGVLALASAIVVALLTFGK